MRWLRHQLCLLWRGRSAETARIPGDGHIYRACKRCGWVAKKPI